MRRPRPYVIVPLVFIALAAFLIARTASTVAEVELAPLPNVEAPAKVARRVVEPSSLSVVKLAHVFALPERTASEVAIAEDPSLPDPSLLVRSSLKVKLLGTMLSASPEWSIATVLDSKVGKASSVMVGDQILSAQVLEIDRDRVIVLNGGRREYIDGAGDVTGVAAVNVEAAPLSSFGVNQRSENEYEVSRAEIEKILSDTSGLMTQIRFMPTFKNGVSQGFKASAVKSDSVFAKIGIQNGDVVKRINGYDLNSLDRMMDVMAKLREAGRIDLEIDRAGSTVTKTYAVH